MTLYAEGTPTKEFFIDMLTRDISLEDAILDLVDNCIDSIARTFNIDLDDKFLDSKAVAKISKALRTPRLPSVAIKVSEAEFSIVDRCGGIDFNSAKDEVFRIGKVTDDSRSRLSVYGVGMKRALFKLGRKITVESRTLQSGFRVVIDTDAWRAASTWHFPMVRLPAARSRRDAGTKITVKRLNTDVRARIGDGIFEHTATDAIASAYALFLDAIVSVRLNGTRVAPKQIPLGMSPKVSPAGAQFVAGPVKITMLAGLAERTKGEWAAERAGWYVFCNGRVVVFADRTDLTGWGVSSPQFVSKFSGFVGLAFFFSQNPEELPWRTTKRGLNTESQSYLVARNRMTPLARPVLSFLNKMYPTGEIEEPVEREIAGTVRATSIGNALSAAKPAFEVKKVDYKAIEKSTVSVQFTVKRKDLEAARRFLKQPEMSAANVGLHAFEYFLERECGR